MWTRRWSGVSVLALLAVAGTAAAQVDERVTLGDHVEVEATFNRPGPGSVSTRLEDRIIAMIEAAAPGSDVFVAMYTFTRLEVAQALLAARRRGVTVRVLVDAKSVRGDNPAVEALRAARGGLDGCGRACVRVCRRGCQGLHINHNKFLLLSRLRDGSRWVVAQSSANFTAGQLHHHNDLVVIKNDRKLYRAFRRYFDDLSRRRWAPRYFRRAEGESGVEAYFFPRLFGPDPIVKMLDRIDCDPDAVIRVAHSRFQSHRLRVARRLRALADQGCDVHVLVRDEPGKDSPGSAVLRELEGLVTVLPYKGRPRADNAIHTKLMLIRARYAGSEEPRHVVLTGSHNLSATSLRFNDEVLLRLENEALFDAYQGFWEGMLRVYRPPRTGAAPACRSSPECPESPR